LRIFFNQRSEEDYENVIIFNGWEDQGKSQKKVQREFDFIILSAYARTIIQIEVKNAFSDQCLSTAADQLNKGFSMFQETFSFPQNEGWTYVKAVYFEMHTNKAKVCAECQKFVLTADSDIEAFLGFHLTRRSAIGATDLVYLKMIKYLLFFMFQTSEPVITAKDTKKHFHKIGNEVMAPHKIMFYRTDQYDVVKNDYKRVLMASTFGTGKTTLLKAKVIKLLERCVKYFC
jgi:hypothetical protein